jgi:hypothetical protein
MLGGGGSYQKDGIGGTCGMVGVKNAYGLSVGTPKGLPGDLSVCGNIIFQGVDLIHLASDRNRRRTVVDVVIDLCVP